jgi:hypothetical protein
METKKQVDYKQDNEKPKMDADCRFVLPKEMKKSFSKKVAKDSKLSESKLFRIFVKGVIDGTIKI